MVVHLFAELEWTRTAAFAATSGLVLLAALWLRENKKHMIPGLVLALILLVLSALIRFPTLPLMTLIALPTLLYFFSKAMNRSVSLMVLSVLALTALSVIGSLWFQKAYYAKDPAWANSLKLLDLDGHLLSYRCPVYNEVTKPIFDSVGWTANDLELFKESYCMDPSLFNIEKLEKLNASFSRFGFNKNSEDSLPWMFSNPYTVLSLLFLTASFFFVPKGSRWFVGASVTWTLLVILFCLWAMKKPERIYLPCLYLQNCLALLLVVPADPSALTSPFRFFSANRWGTILLILFLLASGWMLTIQYSKNRYYLAREVELKEIMKQLDPQDDQLFLTWSTLFPFQEIGALDDHRLLEHFNVVGMSWFTWTPTTQAMLNRFKIKDFSRDIVDNPHVRFICAPVHFNLYRIHMKEKYGLDVVPQVLFMSDQFPVIAIRTAGFDKRKTNE